LAEEKNGFGLHPVLCRSSCQKHFWREAEGREGGKEGGREGGKEGGREKAFLQICNCYPNPNIRYTSISIPIMLRLFVTIGTFFLLFIQQLEKLHQFKFNLRVFLNKF
jgi:hypothetical protein